MVREEELEGLRRRQMAREAAVQLELKEENKKKIKEVEASHKESIAKLVKEKEARLQTIGKDTVCVVDKLKEDFKREEEDMVEEHEKEEREAPSCPVSTLCISVLGTLHFCMYPVFCSVPPLPSPGVF